MFATGKKQKKKKFLKSTKQNNKMLRDRAVIVYRIYYFLFSKKHFIRLKPRLL